MNLFFIFLFILAEVLSVKALLRIFGVLRFCLSMIMPPKEAEGILTRGDIFRLDYVFDGQKYSLIRAINRETFTSAFGIFNGEKMDVTDVLNRYAGPFGDFLGQKVKPEMIFPNISSLEVRSRRTKKVFLTGDVINFEFIQ